jgi:hypothetical protein
VIVRNEGAYLRLVISIYLVASSCRVLADITVVLVVVATCFFGRASLVDMPLTLSRRGGENKPFMESSKGTSRCYSYTMVNAMDGTMIADQAVVAV